MQLVLNTYGAYLSRRGELFQVKVKDQSTEISARKVRSILISTGAAFSSDAVQLAVEKNIDILFLDKYGDPFGRVWHGRPGSTTAIRRLQLVAAQTDLGVQLALGWIGRKFDNQIALLTRMRDRRTRLSAPLTEAIGSLKTLKEQTQDLADNAWWRYGVKSHRHHAPELARSGRSRGSHLLGGGIPAITRPLPL